jgi:hypothetical protein
MQNGSMLTDGNVRSWIFAKHMEKLRANRRTAAAFQANQSVLPLLPENDNTAGWP